MPWLSVLAVGPRPAGLLLNPEFRTPLGTLSVVYARSPAEFGVIGSRA